MAGRSGLPSEGLEFQICLAYLIHACDQIAFRIERGLGRPADKDAAAAMRAHRDSYLRIFGHPDPKIVVRLP